MKISVYIPSFNQKEYLVEAIESVLDQTMRPHQIIIIDDCSNDGSQDVIAGYASKYSDVITPIYHQKNQGIAKTRIDALEAVTGDFVTYVDGDDKYLPTKLEKEAELLHRSTGEKIAFSNFYFTSDTGQRLRTWFDKDLPDQGNVFISAITRDFPRNTLFRCELTPMKCLKKVGFYDSSLKTHEDWDLKIRLTKHFEVVCCEEPLSEYRQHPSGLSKQSFALRLENIERVYKKNLPLLEHLPASDRKIVQKRISNRMAAITQKATKQEFRRKKYLSMARCLMKSFRYQFYRFV